MSQTLRAVVLGGVMTAVFQSVIGGLGFWLAGFQNFAIWGAMIFVASFVPVFGTALVWVPAALFLYVTDSPGSAAFLVGVGVVISTTDNLFRLILIGRRATLHPLLLFLGVFGGLAAVGPMGLIYGLLLVSALAEAVQIYREQTVGLPPDPT
jgi:predicted PurR-regulated permease PerM